MSKTFKNRLAIAAGTISLVWGSIATAAPLANVTGTWTIVGNQHAGSLRISSQTGPLPCQAINGTIYPGTPSVTPCAVITARRPVVLPLPAKIPQVWSFRPGWGTFPM